VIIKGIDLPQIIVAIREGEFDITAEQLTAALSDRLDLIREQAA
jgi:hypothetical protein